MSAISPVTETTIFAHGKELQTSLNTSGRLDKLPETRDFDANREFSGDLAGLSRQHLVFRWCNNLFPYALYNNYAPAVTYYTVLNQAIVLLLHSPYSQVLYSQSLLND